MRERSDGVSTGPKAPSTLLHRLEKAGPLTSEWTDEPGRQRRTCALTDEGAAALAAERTRRSRFLAGMQAVLDA